MKPFFLAITYFLASGQPVEIDLIPTIRNDGNQAYEVMDYLEIADMKRRRFLENLMESDSLFSDIRVELRDPYSGEIFRADRKYAGYVPGLTLNFLHTKE